MALKLYEYYKKVISLLIILNYPIIRGIKYQKIVVMKNGLNLKDFLVSILNVI